jgi:hypothetical protein
LELRSRKRHPLSLPQMTAWSSDEHILGEEETNGHIGRNQSPNGITVVKETVVKSEPRPAGQPNPSGPPIEAWEHTRADHTHHISSGGGGQTSLQKPSLAYNINLGYLYIDGLMTYNIFSILRGRIFNTDLWPPGCTGAVDRSDRVPEISPA